MSATFVVTRQPCHEDLTRAEARFVETQRRLDAAVGAVGTDFYQGIGREATEAWNAVRAARAKVNAWFAAALAAHEAANAPSPQ